MFTIAGILADEEPKTPISPNGFYNASYMYDASFNSVTLDSTDMLNNRSEFTFMFWVYKREDVFWGSWSTGTGGEVNPIFNWSVINNQNNIEFKIRNTSGGHTVVNTNYNWLLKWTLFTVTGSLLSNSIKIYADGVLLNTATMSYPVSDNYLSYSFRRVNSSPYSLAQPLFYDRALSDSEVAEHYVDIDGQVGVLSYNAMTTAQRSGLTYLASFIDDISYNGNEFKDKSTNNVTLSTTPSLTGQQIYVYTDVATSQIYAVNSANLNGTTQYFNAGNPSELQSLTNITCACWVYPTSTGTFTMSKHDSFPSNGGFFVGYGLNGDNKFTFAPRSSSFNANNGIPTTNDFPVNNWYFVICTYDGASIKIYVDGVEEANSSASNALGANTSKDLNIGRNADSGGGLFQGSLAMPMIFNRALTAGELATLYNSGTPLCYADIDTAITNDCVYAPRLANWDTNAGQELVDQSASGITTTNVNSTPFTGTGLNVECSEAPITQYTANYADFDTDQTAYTSPFLDMGALKSSGFSVSFWGNASQYSSSRLFTIGNQAGDPSPSDFIIAMNGQTNSYFQFYDGASFGTLTSSLNFDVLRHITVTYGGTADQNFRLYVDGTLQGTVSGSNYAVGSLDQYVTIGGRTGAQGVFEASGGVKGHVFMFNKKLEQADIDNLSSDPTYVYNSLSEIGLDTNCILSVRCSNWNSNNGSEFTEDTGNATVSLNTGVAGSIAIDGTGPDVISF